MQSRFDFTQSEDLHLTRKRLRTQFGRIPDIERLGPVSQFVRSFLGSRTQDQTSWNAFIRLIRHYRSWDAIADAPVADIEALIWDVTYREIKAPSLKGALRSIRACYGAINLDFLADLDVEQALYRLELMHGVGRKIAAATLNFSTLRKPAFVVDTHILRILRRFGFVSVHAKTEDAYEAVMAAANGFDAGDLLELHWLLKSLGQKTCSHDRARCGACALSDACLKRIGLARTA
jgi:endonuclease III